MRRGPGGCLMAIIMVWLHVVEAWTHYWGSREKIGLVMLRDWKQSNILARGCEKRDAPASTYTQIVASEMGMRYEDVNWKNNDDLVLM